MASRKFINCEIIGPGDIVVALKSLNAPMHPIFARNTFHNINCIQIDMSANPLNAIAFWDCDFDGCNFYSLNLLFYHRPIPSSWNWITSPPTIPVPALAPPQPAQPTPAKGSKRGPKP